ncbi:MAG: carbohydrate-binding domain-containing protein [Ruminococcus sp.]|nr:carbohydrate-binding domain-containing protein [Ruminococcus sp.]
MKNTWKRTLAGLAVLTMALSAFTGCSDNSTSSTSKSIKSSSSVVTEENTEDTETTTASKKKSGSAVKAENTSHITNNKGVIDTTDMFTERDLAQTADISDAKKLTVSDGKTIDITEAGVYVISGSAKNCTIRVEADSESKVQLVLDGVTVENEDFPAVYVVSADKVFVTSTDSENSLSVTGQFTSDGDTNTDAVIFSKEDLVFNGTGALTVYSAYGNGVSCKDDLKVTGGTYDVTTAKDAFEANDSIAICGGDFTVNTQKDGLHCENDEDNTLGSIYISDGTFDITSNSDAIQGTTYVQIDGGTFNIISSEGIEATYVQINGGNITISASDDGINATNKSTACDIAVEFNGGNTTITMGQGDTDAVDANGSIYVNGGTIDITAQMSSFDYDGTAEFNGGTIIINGEEVSEIPQSMMGGPMGGFGGHGGFGGDMGTPPDGGMGTPPDGGFGGGRGRMEQF